MNPAADQTRPPPAAIGALHPFFLAGALFAVLMMALWMPWFLGFIQVPSAWSPQAWFSHELVLGFAPAIAAGAVLAIITAENGRMPIGGLPVAALMLLWIAGRIAMAFSMHLNPLVVAMLSITFLIVLALAFARVVTAHGGRSKIVIAAILFGIVVADGLFHYEMLEFGRPKSAPSLALALVLLLLLMIAGRMVRAFANDPSTTEVGVLSSPLGRCELVALAVSAVTLMVWALAPLLDLGFAETPWVGGLLLIAAALTLAAQLRGAARPFASLRVTSVFVALGFVLTGLGIIRQDYDFTTGGMHAWTVGAIGALVLVIATLALRERRPATAGTIILFGLGSIAGLVWTVAGLYPQWTLALLPVSGLTWIAAFAGLSVLCLRAVYSIQRT